MQTLHPMGWQDGWAYASLPHGLIKAPSDTSHSVGPQTSIRQLRLRKKIIQIRVKVNYIYTDFVSNLIQMFEFNHNDTIIHYFNLYNTLHDSIIWKWQFFFAFLFLQPRVSGTGVSRLHCLWLTLMKRCSLWKVSYHAATRQHLQNAFSRPVRNVHCAQKYQ